MKNKRSCFIILAVLFLGLLGWWLWRKNSPVPAQPSAKSSSVKTPSAKTAGTASAPVSVPGAILPSIGQSIGQNPTTGQQEVKINPALPDTDKMQMILDAENGRELDIYGKVIDQYGAPVVGAKVRGNIATLTFEGTPSANDYTVTDANGLFSFTGLHGRGLGIEPSKDGYALYVGQNWSKDYQPDSANPMVFTMYKLQGAEPMVHQKFRVLLPCDGAAKNLDLVNGKETTSVGGFTVKFLRNPVDIIRGKPFEWTLTLEATGGGLIEIHDAYSYEAPAEGYQETVTISTGPNPKDYTDSTTKSYYYKSADGKYGRITIELQADFQPPPTYFRIEVYLNPNGSRNLEYDATKVAKPPFP